MPDFASSSNSFAKPDPTPSTVNVSINTLDGSLGSFPFSSLSTYRDAFEKVYPKSDLLSYKIIVRNLNSSDEKYPSANDRLVDGDTIFLSPANHRSEARPPEVKWPKFEQLLLSLGWSFDRLAKKHKEQWVKKLTGKTLTIACYRGYVLPGTLRKFMKFEGMSHTQLAKAIRDLRSHGITSSR